MTALLRSPVIKASLWLLVALFHASTHVHENCQRSCIPRTHVFSQDLTRSRNICCALLRFQNPCTSQTMRRLSFSFIPVYQTVMCTSALSSQTAGRKIHVLPRSFLKSEAMLYMFCSPSFSKHQNSGTYQNLEIKRERNPTMVCAKSLKATTANEWTCVRNHKLNLQIVMNNEDL
jgi:hypothetical protein